MEAGSLWVSPAASAVSVHSAGPALRRWGANTGTMRMSAPLPAECTPASYQGQPA